MLKLAAILARLGLGSVMLCWMEWTALGLEQMQSPPLISISVLLPFGAYTGTVSWYQTISQFSFLFGGYTGTVSW